MFKYKSEKYHIDRIVYIIKDSWKSNLDKKNTIKRVEKYLKYKKLDKNDHKFLIRYREQILALDFESIDIDNDVDKLLTHFYSNIRKIKIGLV